MFHVVLFEPEIPPNTGNIIRLCANTGCHLHLIEPLGFAWDNKQLRRAGLDYSEYATIAHYPDLARFISQIQPPRLLAFTTKGTRSYSDNQYQPNDALLFGPETRGLPTSILEQSPDDQRLRLPMLDHSRSLNLANTVAVVVYEAWRQQGFVGGK